MEVFRDQSLIQDLREEVKAALVTDPGSGLPATFNLQRLTALPLLMSVYTEALRLRMSFNVLRDVRESFDMEGYTIGKGSLVQVPTLVAHYDESVWGTDDHPASEFWAYRHVKDVQEQLVSGETVQKRVFAMSGRSGSYFPYGK